MGFCTVMDWRSPTGAPCLTPAPSDNGRPEGILPRLAGALDVRLPAARAMACGNTRRAGPAPISDQEQGKDPVNP